MVELGFGDVLSLAQTIGIVGPLILTLYFSKRQIQSLSIDTQTRVLNDLDKKLHKMAELGMENATLGKVIDKEGKHSREVAFSFSHTVDVFSCVHDATRTQTDIAQAAGITEVTLRNRYRQ